MMNPIEIDTNPAKSTAARSPSHVKTEAYSPVARLPSMNPKKGFAANKIPNREDIQFYSHAKAIHGLHYNPPILPDEVANDSDTKNEHNIPQFNSDQAIVVAQSTNLNDASEASVEPHNKSKRLKINIIITGCCINFYVINLFLTLIIVISLHFSYRTKKTDEIFSALSILKYKFDSQPLVDISLRKINESCPPGYSDIVIGVWPGTQAGCYCPMLTPQLYPMKKCPPHCENKILVPAIHPQNMTYFQSIGFCGKRAVPLGQYPQKECQKNQKLCYPGGCFDECPVTDITVNDPKNILNISVTRQLNAPPIIGFRIVRGNQSPCLNPNVSEIKSSSETLYPLLRNSTISFQTSCGKFGSDETASEVGIELGLEDLQSQKWWPQVSSLPNYINYLEGQSFKLYAIRQSIVANKETCYAVSTSQVQKAKDAFNRVDWSIMGYAFLAISCLVFFVIVLMCSGISFQNRQRGDSNERPIGAGSQHTATSTTSQRRTCKHSKLKVLVRLFEGDWKKDWILLMFSHFMFFVATACLVTLFVITIGSWHRVKRTEQEFQLAKDEHCFENKNIANLFISVSANCERKAEVFHRCLWYLLFTTIIPHSYYLLVSIIKGIKTRKSKMQSGVSGPSISNTNIRVA